MNDTFLKALSVMRFIASGAAEGHAYKWDGESIAYEIKTRFGQVRNHDGYGESFWREVFALSAEEKYALGFKTIWEGEEKMLIPLWIWECLPDDMIFEGKKKKDIDNDTRFGCVCWRA